MYNKKVIVNLLFLTLIGNYVIICHINDFLLNIFFQETLYWPGYHTSEISSGLGVSSVDTNLTENKASTTKRLTDRTDQLPPLVSPVIFSKRSPNLKGNISDRTPKSNQKVRFFYVFHKIGLFESLKRAFPDLKMVLYNKSIKKDNITAINFAIRIITTA